MKSDCTKILKKLFFLLTLSLMVSFCIPSFQCSVRTVSAASKTKTKYWLTKKNGKVYYINSEGKKATGLVTIKKKKYYFDSKGVQCTGWQKIDGYYYYFYPEDGADGYMATGIVKISYKKQNQKYYFDSKGRQRTGGQTIDGNYYYFTIINGKKGFMVTSATVNNIYLKKNGKAKQTTASLAKLNVLIKANQLVEAAVTSPASMTRTERLRACFDYLLANYRYSGSPTFHYSTNWDQVYALQIFDSGRGACYAFGAAFAYIANAVGCPNCYAVSSGGHGWAEVNGYVYDPSWHLVDTRYSYFAVPMSLSGVGGRPNYKSARTYYIQI
ncbi:MAG: hypothetical protein LIO94_04855 [Clostridiales bacterium]|nr:hypothetical protein [Clostridiales bacterium]